MNTKAQKLQETNPCARNPSFATLFLCCRYIDRHKKQLVFRMKKERKKERRRKRKKKEEERRRKKKKKEKEKKKKEG